MKRNSWQSTDSEKLALSYDKDAILRFMEGSGGRENYLTSTYGRYALQLVLEISNCKTIMGWKYLQHFVMQK